MEVRSTRRVARRRARARRGRPARPRIHAPCRPARRDRRGRRGNRAWRLHGKTTTSCMIAFVLAELGADPTFVVGGDVPAARANARAGSGPRGGRGGRVGRLARTPAAAHRHRPERLARPPRPLRPVASSGAARRLDASLPAGAALVLGDGVELPVARRRFGAGWGGGGLACLADQPTAGPRFVLRRPAPADLAVALAVPGAHNALNAWRAGRARVAGSRPSRRPSRCRASVAQGGASRPARSRGIRFVDDYGHHPREVAAMLASARARGTGG